MPSCTIGIRARVIPLVRRSSVVAMKFNAPSNEAMQKTKIERAHSVCPNPSPGPVSLPTALSGAYAVHPASGGPSPTKNADDQNAERDKGNPERHHVEAGEGHIFRANLNRQKIISERGEWSIRQHEENHQACRAWSSVKGNIPE